eukprot:TRINITY_DN8715_c0_g2_i1.p1 TRINITY_DN8715_c0_g2~~TRINITY_DN8715_c0_g2_i1.p1  ORF type:complete len:188 (-),score=7.48 TRINITY_DN8715_c0_g2_i1:532-1095(-)
MVPRIDPTLSGERSSQKCNTKCCGSRTPTQGDLLPPKEVPHGPTIWSDGPSLRCPPGLVGDLVVGFDDHYDVGEYHCAGCETLLYTSRMKFDCGCGWPGTTLSCAACSNTVLDLTPCCYLVLSVRSRCAAARTAREPSLPCDAHGILMRVSRAFSQVSGTVCLAQFGNIPTLMAGGWKSCALRVMGI